MNKNEKIVLLAVLGIGGYLLWRRTRTVEPRNLIRQPDASNRPPVRTPETSEWSDDSQRQVAVVLPPPPMPSWWVERFEPIQQFPTPESSWNSLYELLLANYQTDPQKFVAEFEDTKSQYFDDLNSGQTQGSFLHMAAGLIHGAHIVGEKIQVPPPPV